MSGWVMLDGLKVVSSGNCDALGSTAEAERLVSYVIAGGTGVVDKVEVPEDELTPVSLELGLLDEDVLLDMTLGTFAVVIRTEDCFSVELKEPVFD